jgi:hypothetical protein
MTFKTEWRKHFERVKFIESVVLFGADSPLAANCKEAPEVAALVPSKTIREDLIKLKAEAFGGTPSAADYGDPAIVCQPTLGTVKANDALLKFNRVLDRWIARSISTIKRDKDDPDWDVAGIGVHGIANYPHYDDSHAQYDWSGGFKVAKSETNAIIGQLAAAENGNTAEYKNLRKLMNGPAGDRWELEATRVEEYLKYTKYQLDFEAYFDWCSEVVTGSQVQALVERCGGPNHPDDVDGEGATGNTREDGRRVNPAIVEWFDQKIIKPDLAFARIPPSTRELIVRNLQRDPWGEVVAVTGDGDDDVDQLKTADVGVACGLAGSTAAKAAADAILDDDNFATIVAATLAAKAAKVARRARAESRGCACC